MFETIELNQFEAVVGGVGEWSPGEYVKKVAHRLDPRPEIHSAVDLVTRYPLTTGGVIVGDRTFGIAGAAVLGGIGYLMDRSDLNGPAKAHTPQH